MIPPDLDHLVWGASDLESECRELERRLGVHPAPGGRHPRWGTRNALLSLGAGAYLEILAPDPERSPVPPRRFGLDRLESPRFLTWAVRARDLEARARKARAAGIEIGTVERGARRRADGVELAWTLTVIDPPPFDGLLPFLIDWGETPHPSRDAPPGLAVTALWAEHPDPAPVLDALHVLGVALEVREGPVVRLVAQGTSPRGAFTLGALLPDGDRRGAC